MSHGSQIMNHKSSYELLNHIIPFFEDIENNRISLVDK